MKKFCLIAVVMLLLFTGCTASPDSYDPVAELEFPNLNWGLSVKQVEGVYGTLEQISQTPLADEETGFEIVSYSCQAEIFDETANLQFDFWEKEEVSYLFSVSAYFYGISNPSEIDLFLDEKILPVLEELGEETLYRDTSSLSESEREKWKSNMAYLGIHEPPRDVPFYITDVGRRKNNAENTYYAVYTLNAGHWLLANSDMVS